VAKTELLAREVTDIAFFSDKLELVVGSLYSVVYKA
jgi:hypothetical protein